MNAAPPGWNPDPTGRHEYRYWDGTVWTDDVSDGGVAATDPLGGAALGGDEPTAPFDATATQPTPPSEPTAPFEPTAPYDTAQPPGGFGTPPGQAPGGYGAAPGQGYSGYGGPPGAPDAYGGTPPPPSAPGRSGPPIGLLVGLGVLALIVVVVLVVVLTRDDGDDTATDDTTTTTTTTDDTEPETTTAVPETTLAGPQDADVFSLAVGDCLVEETPDGEVQSLAVVPCDQPHASEIYYVHIIDAAGLPGADEMEAIARDECLPQFETFVGVPYEQSALLVTWLEPTQSSWDSGDRELLCIAVDPEGDATGSFAGTAR